jgi:ATP-binding cassette subfamily F protein uup
MAPPLLTLRDVRVTFGGTPCLDGAELLVRPRERICLVGRNGSGKSTLLKVAAGMVEGERGERFVHPGATVRYLPQEPDLTRHATTLEYVEAGLAPGDEPYRARQLLDEFGLTGQEDTRSLSGGEARRAALARVLAPEPDILLLDEPTNHLDLPAIEWLEAAIRASRSAIVLISHDRRFLENLAEACVWLDRGVTNRLDQGFAAFEAWRDRLLEEEEIARQKLDQKILAEEHWLRYGVTARRKRNVRRLANLTALRTERREGKRRSENLSMAAAEGETTGKLVIEARGIAKSYGEEVVVAPLSLRVGRGDRIGIVGRNGAGKTTLLNLLTGALAPDAGSIRIADTVQMATLDQKRESLPPDVTLSDALTDGRGDYVTINGANRHVASYMKDFLFRPEQARTPLKVLSGGERGRVMLARALAKPSNLLVLDEPTNDLDLETLDLLQELVADYPGTVLLISHDRDFLDRTVSSVIMAEGDGRWQEYAGGYSDMLAQRGSGVAARPATERTGERREARPETPERGAAPGKRKLSFREKHALETLPKEMDRLNAEIARAEALLGQPDLFSRDPAGFQRASTALTTARDKLAAAEDEWLRLEMLREDVEGP